MPVIEVEIKVPEACISGKYGEIHCLGFDDNWCSIFREDIIAFEPCPQCLKARRK